MGKGSPHHTIAHRAAGGVSARPFLERGLSPRRCCPPVQGDRRRGTRRDRGVSLRLPPPCQLHSSFHSPARATERPTILFLARRAIRLGFPEAMVETSFQTRAAWYICETRLRLLTGSPAQGTRLRPVRG